MRYSSMRTKKTDRVSYFSQPGGEPIEEYLDRVRDRFGQWIRHTCDTLYDEEWLNYQFEIGQRHH